ncbi:hypothetical protein [Streptomyces triticisoli]|uniref:hypothetical protein n=1 Tax=Streptomyces triticisoli TaxID=2182797 RepID=UPI0013001D5C|nr:hypothetical protein [Streptomyces triticisoli]
MPNPPVMGHHGHEVTNGQLMGGVMKLGKALATGVAQEQPPVSEEEAPGLPEETQEPQTEAPEEVPAAR